METIEIAIIGGSGLYDLPEANFIKEVNISTPFGFPSAPISIFELNGISVAFLPRHGKGHTISPSELPVRANIFALKTLGVKKIIAISAVGSLQEHIPPEDFVIPDQIIDRTKRLNENTFFSDGIVGHVSFASPFCENLSSHLHESLKPSLGNHLHFGGTYVCMEGPAFSTKAESLLYRSFGAHIIGMTALPEAKLAREAEMCYSMIAMSTDYDCWKESEEAVSVDMVITHMTNNTQKVKSFLGDIIKSSANYNECTCHSSAKFAIISSPKEISEETKKRLEPLYGKYYQ